MVYRLASIIIVTCNTSDLLANHGCSTAVPLCIMLYSYAAILNKKCFFFGK
jgi:hypothetical protein